MSHPPISTLGVPPLPAAGNGQPAAAPPARTPARTPAGHGGQSVASPNPGTLPPRGSTCRHYILVDFENVHDCDLDRLAGRPAHAVILLGERQHNLPRKLALQMYRRHDQVSVLETGCGGPNALDMVLALHLGALWGAAPEAHFHIVSKDKDYEPLIGFLRRNKSAATRHESFNRIPVLMTPAERVQWLAEHYRRRPNGRATVLRTLAKQIDTLFGHSLDEAEVDAAIRGLVQRRVLAISDEGTVSFTP